MRVGRRFVGGPHPPAVTREIIMTKTTIAEDAVVLAASIAGLLAARVLADAYARVTVIERDYLPHDLGHRRGVPQGRHLHALQPRGRQLLDELFPASPNRWCGPAPGSGTTWVVCAGSCQVSDCVRLTSADPRWPPVGHCWRDRSGDESRRCPRWVSSRAATRGRHVLPANRQDDRYPLGDRGQRRSGLPRRGWPPQHQGAVGQYLPPAHPEAMREALRHTRIRELSSGSVLCEKPPEAVG
jgi:hypothetical protein